MFQIFNNLNIIRYFIKNYQNSIEFVLDYQKCNNLSFRIEWKRKTVCQPPFLSLTIVICVSVCQRNQKEITSVFG